MQTPDLPQRRLNAPVYGWLLGVSTLAALAIITHHPTANLGDPHGLSNITAVAAQGQWVHGTLTGMVLLFATGFSGFAWRLGIAHPLVMAGWLSYVCGSLAMMLAALFDGFVIADIAGRMADQGQTAYDLIHLSGITIQALAKLGFVLMAVAALAWGLALQHHKGLERWLGLAGIAIGGLSAVFILTMPYHFNVGRLLAYMAVQSVWHIAVALWMIRSKPSA